MLGTGFCNKLCLKDAQTERNKNLKIYKQKLVQAEIYKQTHIHFDA